MKRHSAPMHFRRLGDDEDDISDVINSQREINRLRSEVRRLQNQCDRLKNELSANERDEDGYNVTAVLQNKVKSLEVALSAEREHHERELQALERLHRSQPAVDDKSSFEDIEKESLKKQSERLQEELRSANQRIIQLEECCDGLDRRCENTDLEAATLRDELDVCKMKLLENVESGQIVCALFCVKSPLRSATINIADCINMQELRASFMTELDKTKRAVSLHNQIRANTFLHERSALTAQLLKTKCQEEQLEKDLIAIMDALERSTLDTGRLMEDLGDKRSQDLTRKILNAFTKDESSADKERVDDDAKSTDSLAWENDPGLQESEVERLKQQVNEFELYRNVVENEKKALEDVLVKQRDDLKEKEKAIKSLNSQMAENLDESIKIEEAITEIKELLGNEKKEQEISRLEKLLQEVENRYAALHSLENNKETTNVELVKINNHPSSETELNNRISACEEKVNDIIQKLDEDNTMKINESVQLELEMLRARLNEAESLANPDPELCSLKGRLEESQNALDVALKNQKLAEIAFEQLKFEYDNKMADFEKIRAEMVILEDRNRKALQLAQELSIQKSLNDELVEKLEKRDEELGLMKNGIKNKDLKVNNDDVDERIVEGQADDDNSDNLKKTIEALKREKDELQTTLPSVRAAFQTATMQLADSKQQLSQALSEKEQVSAVLNDKSRENAQLKRENAKLLDSIADLKKKLENAGNVRVKFDSSTIESDNEMSKDTIQKLSLLIRERDQELEMLRQKCDSLGDLLQSSGQDLQTAHQLAQLTQDRAVLTNALQQKHAESVGYHQEVVRLSNTVSKLQGELVELRKSFEEKSDALAKATLDVSELRQVCLQQEECAQELKKKIDIDVNNVDANNLEDDVQEKRLTINKLEKLLAERDATESQLQSHMASLQSQQEKLEEQLLSTKVSLESTLIDLENATSERDLAKAEKDEALNRACTLQSEIIELRQKATSYQLELNDCKARLESVKKDDERESAWEGHVKGVTQERDKVIRKNADLTNSLEQSKNEVTTLKNREMRLQSELERLRAHLIQMEDGHTQDSILSSQREAALREKLELAEKTANDRLKTVEGTKSAADSTVKQLRLQISEISRQRDEAYVQNTNLRSQLEQHVTAVKNLQLVLEQFEAERADGESKAYEEVKRYRHDVEHYKDHIRRLESELEEAREGLEAARRLSEQLDRKSEAISALKEEGRKFLQILLIIKNFYYHTYTIVFICGERFN
ncbi:DgyrCDS9905 [Dimorphilus gyrociliatus]|uniref:DgyrCDS9905 n=1 Tax=Dimorphilus gyrociliatus TaxID=2664684 RepID=A0A7I8W0L8_9ANNE|nr:DgyrCDS9905 [Dimorphilus gyrociliatus]